jgi:transposase
MAEGGAEVSTKELVDTNRGARSIKRRHRSEAFKRQIVAETLEPGSSVSIVARRHDVNANQVFKWRRDLLPKEPAAVVENGRMLPVEIVPERDRGRPRPRPRGHRSGFIEIEFGCGARVSVHGEVAAKTLRQVIELLR